jgi:Chalcone isomerase-like
MRMGKAMRLAAAMAAGALATTLVLAQAVEREGVKLEPTVQLGGSALQLNGAGVRTRAIFKVYVGALYVPAKSDNPATLIAQKGPRRLQLVMLRNVDADSFAGPLNDGLKNNHSEAQLAALKTQIDAFNAVFKSVGEAKKGDVIGIEYLPDSGTRITVNGQPKGAPIPGEEFYAALLRIWLGDKPADADLKKGLLGA